MSLPCCWAKLMGWSCTCGQKITKHDERELRELLIYAGGIYHRSTMTKPNPGWGPCDDVQGMLSQLSNALRGISDSVDDNQKASEAMAEWLPRAERAEENCRKLLAELRKDANGA